MPEHGDRAVSTQDKNHIGCTRLRVPTMDILLLHTVIVSVWLEVER